MLDPENMLLLQICLFHMESNFGSLCSLKVIQIILNYIKKFVNFKHEVIQMYLLWNILEI